MLFEFPAIDFQNCVCIRGTYLPKSAPSICKLVCKKYYVSWDLHSKAIRWELTYLRKYNLLYNKFVSYDHSPQKAIEPSIRVNYIRSLQSAGVLTYSRIF